MSSASAHAATVSVFCDRYGCTQEAEPGKTRCREHSGPSGVRGTVSSARLELAAKAAQLRADGRTITEIAALLGLSRSYASALIHDPDGSEARRRKDGYRKPCPECGTLMTGSDGLTGAPALCEECTHVKQHEDRFWTREEIIQTFIAFREQNGRPPAVVDLHAQFPSVQEKISPERVAEAKLAIERVPLPLPQTVTREFGSWVAALEAAGMPPNPTGGPSHRGRRKLKTFVVLELAGDAWVKIGSVDAMNSTGAVTSLATGLGTFVAVPSSMWVERRTKTVIDRRPDET